MKKNITETKPADSNAISLAGEFAVLSQLALKGFDASLTLGHTKGVDILVSSLESGNMCRFEVKTSYRNKPTTSKLFGHTMNWIMGSKHEGVINDRLFFCFVNIEQSSNSFRFFIVPNSVVAEYVEKQHQYWLARDNGKHPQTETTMRTFRIGLDELQSDYQIKTPLSTEYESRWDLLV